MTIKEITDDCIYRKRSLDGPFVRTHVIAAFDELWRSHKWRFRLVRGQITAVADYTTGGVLTLTQGDTAVTGTGTTWTQAFTGRHLRPTNTNSNADARDYLITARSSTTALTIEAPYEGTSISSSTAYEIYKKWYELPPDFAMLADEPQESGTAQVVRHVTRTEFDMVVPSANASGSTFWIVDAGNSTFTKESAGTVTMTENSTAVSGSSTAFLEAAHKGRRFRVRGLSRYGDFIITAVGSTTALTLNRAWRGSTKSGLAFDIDPAGERLVELYPRPSANTSILIWYYKTLPPISIDTEDPYGLPIEFHDAWHCGALARLGLVDPADYEAKLGPLMEQSGLVAHERTRSSPYGGGGEARRSLLPSDYPPYSHR